jgi:hypothetical protein
VALDPGNPEQGSRGVPPTLHARGSEALVFGQLGFIGHATGHKQIFRTRRANDLVGYLHAGLHPAPIGRQKRVPALDGEVPGLRKQVPTSRNVRGSRLVDFALGGLNYQIEHHQRGLFRSYAQVLRRLHAVGAPLRAASARR